MRTSNLTPADIALIKSLPPSELNQFITNLAATDEREAAALVRELDRYSLVTTDKQRVAEFFGISEETVNLWQRKGMPHRPGGRGVRGTYDLEQCAQWLAEQRAGVSADDKERTDVDIKFREEKSRMAEIQRRKLEGELVEVARITESYLRMTVAIRKGVDQLTATYGQSLVEDLGRIVDEAKDTFLSEVENK